MPLVRNPDGTVTYSRDEGSGPVTYGTRDTPDPERIEAIRTLGNLRKGAATNRRQVDALGGNPEPERGGVLNTLFSALDAARAGVFAAGAEASDALFGGSEHQGSFEELKERFNARQGFGDTQALKYQDDDGVLERALKATGAFVGDVATDPLTYLTFGTVATAKQGATAVRGAVKSKAAGGLLKGMSREAREKLAKGSLQATTRKQLQEAAREAGQDMSDEAIERYVSQRMGDVGKLTDEALDDLASDALADKAAGLYATSGDRAVRDWLTDEFGEQGRKLFDEIPNDIKGGLAVRAPFASKPIAGGKGSGVLLEKVVGDDTAQKLNQFVQGNKLKFRASSPVNAAISKLGRDGQEWADFVKRVRTAGNDVAGQGWAEWRVIRDYRNLDARLRAEDGVNLQATAAVIGSQLRQWQKAGRTEDIEEFQRLFHEMPMMDEADQVRAAMTDAGSLVNQVRKVFNDEFKSLQELVPDQGALQGYGIRHTTDKAKEWFHDTQPGSTSGGSGGVSGPLMPRSEKFADLVMDEDGVVRIERWHDVREINKAFREAHDVDFDLFEEDPLAATIGYMRSVQKARRQHLLTKHLSDSGALVRHRARNKVTKAVNASQESVGSALHDLGKATASVGRRAGGSLDPAQRAMVEETLDGVSRVIDEVAGGIDGNPELADDLAGLREALGDYTTKRLAGEELAPDELAEKIQAVSRGLNRLGEVVPDNANVQGAKGLFDDALQESNEVLADALDVANLPEDPEAAQEVIEAVVDKVKDGGLRDLGEGGKFMDDAIKTLTKHGEFGIISMKDDAGTIAPAFLADFVGMKSVRDSILRLEKAKSASGELDGFIDNVFRPYMTMFRYTATVARPGFTPRNVGGGTVNNFVGGVGVKRHVQSAKVLVTAHKARLNALRELGYDRMLSSRLPDDINVMDFNRAYAEQFEELLKGQTYKGHDMAGLFNLYKTWEGGHGSIDAARRSNPEDFLGGLHDVGNLRKDLRGAQGKVTGTVFTQKQIDEAKSNASRRMMQAANKSINNAYGNAMSDLSGGAEDYMRFAAFLEGVERYGLDDGGLSANLLMKALHFDYGDLSEFEARVLRNAIPFYTWMRNNIPLQIRGMMTDPSRLMKIVRANEAAQTTFGDPDQNEDELPQWVSEAFGWSTRAETGEGHNLAVNLGALPITDLNNWFGPDGKPQLKENISSLNPLITVAAELAMQRDTFTGAAYDENGVKMPAQWKPVQPALHAMGLTKGRDAEGNLYIDEGAYEAVKSLFPPVSQAERLLPGGSTDQSHRRISNTASGFGIPLSTLTERQQSGELRRQAYDARTERDRILRELGWTNDQLDSLLESSGVDGVRAAVESRREQQDTGLLSRLLDR